MIAALLWFAVGAFFAGMSARCCEDAPNTPAARMALVAEMLFALLLGPLMLVVVAGYGAARAMGAPTSTKEEG